MGARAVEPRLCRFLIVDVVRFVMIDHGRIVVIDHGRITMFETFFGFGRIVGSVFDEGLSVRTPDFILLSRPISTMSVTGRAPRSTGPRFDIGSVVHDVNVLERETGTLVEEEVDDQGANQVTGGENETIVVTDGSGDGLGEETDHEIPTPIGTGSQSALFGTRSGGESFTDQDPDPGTPSGSETEDEHTGRDDEEFTDAGMTGRIFSDPSGGEDE